MNRIRGFLMGLLSVCLLAGGPAGAQYPAPVEVRTFSQDELDQLVAPIALYPDQLLSQIFIAATYPLEVVQAARFVQQNPGLSGEALDQALAERRWDPSVQSLAAFPQVLAMMNEHLDWMQRLGDAFITDPQRVMDEVQLLRQRARGTGNLQSTPQQQVSEQDNAIVIEPAQPDAMYVPVYNPEVVYGPWWAPDYRPWFWYPPAIYGYPVGAVITTGLVFGAAWAISHDHWGWARPDWRRHGINIDARGNRFWNRPGRVEPPPGGTWQHSPDHRRGVAYPDARTRDRFVRVDPDAVRARQEFRGRQPAWPEGGRPVAGAGGRPVPSAPQPPGIAPQPPRGAPQQPVRPPQRAAAPPFDPGISRQQVIEHAQRGQQSRQAIGAPPAGHAPPAAPSAGHAPSAAPQSREAGPRPK